jgi:predicted peptidase
MLRRLGPLLAVLFATSPAAACAAPLPAGPADPHGHFVARALDFEGRHYRYQVFVPAAAAAQPRPIVLFLHGSGERGRDGHEQTEAGLGPYLRAHADQFPALVVFPQAPDDEQWMGRNARMALATLDAASREFGADPSRTYLTGMSMGGYGSWETALLAPHRFAALVPVCGAVRRLEDDDEEIYVSQLLDEPDPYATLVAALPRVPVWMFHGARDDVVPPADDRLIYRAGRAANANIRYSEYAEGNHNVWDATYADPALWRWLFAQRLPDPPVH